MSERIEWRASVTEICDFPAQIEKVYGEGATRIPFVWRWGRADLGFREKRSRFCLFFLVFKRCDSFFQLNDLCGHFINVYPADFLDAGLEFIVIVFRGNGKI